MADGPYKQRILYDAIGPLFDGMNAGADPHSLPRTQAAYLGNSTIRNDFARPRAAYRKLTLDFGGDGLLQQRFTQSQFQGACFYQPDAGFECLIASIAGRMFKAEVNGTAITVSDISIEGDTDLDGASIAWLWQAENFIIKNDAIKLPVFFDGNISRRSLGTGAALTSLNADYTAAAIGTAASTTFAAPYIGPINALLSITVGGVPYLFQVTSNTTGYLVRFTNQTDTPGSTVSASTNVIWKPYFVGPSSPSAFTVANQFGIQSSSDIFQYAVDAKAFQVGVGSRINIPGVRNGNVPFNGPWRIIQITTQPQSTLILIRPDFTVTPGMLVQFTANALATISGVDQQDIILGTTAGSFTAPAVNSSVDVNLSLAYTGQRLIYVWIGNAQYFVVMVVQNNPSSTVALVNLNAPTSPSFFASGSVVSTLNELPIGRMGAYWRGRNWVALTGGRKFIAGDQRGGTSGTAGYQKRDSVLRVYENNLLNGGGSFSIPSNAGDIQAIIGTAQLDAALGQGPVAIIATNIVFSCQAPTDRTIWQSINNPILSESAISSGGEGQNSTVINNSDPTMRSKDGIRSLIYARRDFNTYGNVPISREVQTVLDEDEPTLLVFGSAIIFNNRLLMTAHPKSSGLGIYHDKLIALNSDPLSSLKGKRPPAYDGIWTGLNVLQLITGKFGGVDRCLAFCLNTDLDVIEIWEILPSEGPRSLTNDDGSAIVQDIQSSALDFGEAKECLRLLDGEIMIDRMTEDVTFTAYYKPDQWPDWVQWRTWTAKFDLDRDPGFRPRQGLGTPSDRAYDNVNSRPLRDGYTFQFRLLIQGNCRFKGATFKATTIPKPEFAPVSPDSV